MKAIKSIALFAVLLLLPTAAYADYSLENAQKAIGSVNNIVTLAKTNPEVSTLVIALSATDVASVLQGEGPFTVFAPSNAAFAKLPATTLQSLLKPDAKGELTNILKYHVVPGKILAADMKSGKLKTLQGKDLDVVVQGADVTVNGAKVIKTDIVGSNGVIHVIDTVLMP